MKDAFLVLLVLLALTLLAAYGTIMTMMVRRTNKGEDVVGVVVGGLVIGACVTLLVYRLLAAVGNAVGVPM